MIVNDSSFPIAAGITEIDEGAFTPVEFTRIYIVGVHPTGEVRVTDAASNPVAARVDVYTNSISVVFQETRYISVRFEIAGVLWRVDIGT